MSRYIDADALWDAYWNTVWHRNADRDEIALPILEDAPTADVAPVVHGRWEYAEFDISDYWRCSACGEDWFFEYDPTDADTRVNYCPNCGAKMDEVRE